MILLSSQARTTDVTGPARGSEMLDWQKRNKGQGRRALRAKVQEASRGSGGDQLGSEKAV